MKDLIIYHRVDFDGIFSAIIAKRALGEDNVDLYGMNYNDKVPDLCKFVKKYDKIYVLDFSFNYPDMKYLRNSGKLHWIDHHVTAIQDSLDHDYSDAPGIRDTTRAATELTWKFFNPTTEMPKTIKLISAYDIWDHDSFDWAQETLALQVALKTKYGINLNSISSVFHKLINDEEILDHLLELGRDIGEFNSNRWASAVKSFGFEITIDGKHKGICMLGTEFTSSVFQSVEDEYNLFCVANRRGPDEYSVSLYGHSDKIGDFSCGDYMKKHYLGGGHKGAAGGKLRPDQFQRLIKYQEL